MHSTIFRYRDSTGGHFQLGQLAELDRECGRPGTRLTMLEGAQARSVIRRFVQSASANDLAELLDSCSIRVPAGERIEAVARLVAQQAGWRIAVAREAPLPLGRSDGPPEPPPPPPKPPEPGPEPVPTDQWVEVTLVDDQDRPVANIEYEITLSDGRIRRDRTNAQGVLRFEDLPAGNCELKLLGLDDAAWERV